MTKVYPPHVASHSQRLSPHAAAVPRPRCIAFSQSSHYTQIKAKSLIGLGNIERLNNNYIKAKIHQQQAVELLEKIAAKCDLAEAYFQLGITLQNHTYFQRAIAIYEQIPAPKQVERVKKQLID